MAHLIRKDTSTVQKDILTNVVKMLADRKWISSENIPDIIKSLFEKKNDEGIYTIKLNVDLLDIAVYEESENKSEWKNFNGKNIHQKIAGKSQSINDFIAKYNNVHKIIIVENINEKVKQMIMTATNNRFTEIFIEDEFMLNLLEHESSPKYEILTIQEADEIKESYKMSKRQTQKMYDTDQAARHFYLKRGQLVRIIRNSEMTGESVAYRLIIHRGSTALA
jgi:DNA-directed RNA polymerase subunit H (RpoH/RPB5)